MTGLGNEQVRGAYAEIRQSADTIVQRSLSLHALFDEEWGEPSYHNHYHIMATLETIDAVFDSMICVLR